MDGEVARPAAAVPVSTPRPHGKRQLARWHIEAHTIQRAASPKKKKALDPLRYMPERAAFFALFTVAVELEDAGVGEAPRRVFRTYKQFRALHSRMLKMYPRSNLPRDLPAMRKKRYDNDYIEQKRQELNAYLAEILRVPEVRTSKLLREFLEDTHLSDDSEDDDGNSTSSKILEGLPGTIVTVRAGQSFSLSLTLANIGDTASWQFTTKKHNIGFSVTFNGQIVKPYAREESTVKAIKGFYRCTTPGICTLDWDNTYTWSKAKVLVYWAEVEKAVQAPAAPASAPAALGGSASVPPLLTQGLTPAPPSPLSSSDASDRSRSFPSIDSAAGLGGEGDGDRRRSGYIAQTRNRSMYPRRIVNSSISLITKPFVSGLARSTSTSEEHVKAGSLIVERSVKFRGRNWYRKWFVLDTRKCMLRYFESEVAAQRGLSQSKLNLNNKHASLAITSSMALDSAPTPYMFIVRTRKRCWKICAPSHAEYTAWEHAISTAIFAAQLSREARAEKKRKRKKGKSGDYREAGDGGRGSGGSTALATGDRLSIDDDDEEEDDDDDSSKNDDDNESEESDDEDAEAATGGGERDDTDEEELPCSSDTNPVISRSVIPAVSELYEAPTPAVPTTVNVERQGMTLRQLPAQWKLVALVSVNGVCLTMRWMPALFVVVILVAVDWYLMLRFMKKSWHEKALHEHFNKLD